MTEHCWHNTSDVTYTAGTSRTTRRVMTCCWCNRQAVQTSQTERDPRHGVHVSCYVTRYEPELPQDPCSR